MNAGVVYAGTMGSSRISVRSFTAFETLVVIFTINLREWECFSGNYIRNQFIRDGCLKSMKNLDLCDLPFKRDCFNSNKNIS